MRSRRVELPLKTQLSEAYKTILELQALSNRLVKATEEAAQALGIPYEEEGQKHAG